MAQLTLSLLGPFQATLAGDPITDFRTHNARSLLAFLAMHPGHLYDREFLAGMLWPDIPTSEARANLRQVLYRLRKVLGGPEGSPPFLISSHSSIGFNQTTNFKVDAAEFTRLLSGNDAHGHDQLAHCPACMARLQRALDLYRGDFISGLPLPPSQAFQEWCIVTQEQLHARAMTGLETLAAHYAQRQDYPQAIHTLKRLLIFEPWREEGHRQLMRVLALDGQTGAALAQYEQCRQVLADEFGSEPEAETQELATCIGAGVLRPVDIVLENPYKGLHPFGIGDADNFFGREAFVERLRTNLARLPVNVIIGSSGSGKSSVLHAGVAAHLRDSTSANGGEADESSWQIITLRPGARPFKALAEQLVATRESMPVNGVPMRSAKALSMALAEGETDLVTWLTRPPSPDQEEGRTIKRTLLIVDQLEELYSLCDDPETQQRFIDTLLAGINSVALTNGEPLPPATEVPPITILIALRADFASQTLSYGPFIDVIQRGGLILGPMRRADLRRAIEQPAHSRGITFEVGLVDRLLDDAGHEPGNLPLLQFTLSELWRHQALMQMTHAAYNTGGGLAGVLQSHAEQVYANFDTTAQEPIHHIFSRLVHPVGDAGATRRVAMRTEFSDDDWRLVQQLADARLVVTTRDKRGSETVELAHEALIKHWPRLQNWTDADREFNLWLRRLRRLRGALRQWQRKGHDDRALLYGVALDEAIFWLHAQGPYLNEAETAFIDASVAQRDQEFIAQEAARQQILAQAEALATAEQARADTAARGRVRLTWLSATLAIIALLLLAVGLFAYRQRNTALRAADMAQSLNLATSAQFALSQDNTDLALSLALAAVDVDDPPHQARFTLADAAYAPGAQRVFSGHEGPVNAVTLLPDGQRALSAAADGNLILWDLGTKPNTGQANGQIIRVLEGRAAPVVDVVLVDDGETAVSAAADGALILWDLASGQPLQTSAVHPGGACCVDMIQDGAFAISGGADGSLAVWDIEAGEVRQRVQTPGGAVVALAVSPDGATLLSAQADHSLALYDISAAGKVSAPRHVIRGHPSVVDAYTDAGEFIPGHYGVIRAVDFTPDGQTFLSAAEDQLLLVGDVASGQLRTHYNLDIALHSMVAETNAQALIGTLDNRVVRLDLQSGETPLQLLGHAGRVQALALTPDRGHVLSGAADGVLRLWHLHNGAEVRRVDEDVWGYASLAVSPSGDRVLAGLWNGLIHLIDYETGARVCTLVGHEDMVFGGIHFLPDGRRAVSADGDMLNFTPTATLRLWDLETCSQIAILDGERLPVWDLDLSQDGRYAVYGAHDGVHLWDLETGEARLLLDIGPQNARSVAFSPDGQSVLVGPGKGLSQNPDYSLIQISRESGAEIRRFPGHTETVADLAISPDGKLLLSSSLSGEGFLWDLVRGEIMREFTGHDSGVVAAIFSPDGRLAASADQGGRIIVWDVESGNALRNLDGHNRQVLDLAFHPNGDSLLSAADDDTLRAWRVDTDDDALLAWIDENHFVAELTCEERARYYVMPLCDEHGVRTGS